MNFILPVSLDENCLCRDFLRHKITSSSRNYKNILLLLIIEYIITSRHDEMTYEEIAYQYPKDFAERDQDKLRYRYPFGESYVDVCE